MVKIYKVIAWEFLICDYGKTTVVVQNVHSGQFFSIHTQSSSFLWDMGIDGLIRTFENDPNHQKFFSLEDCYENLGKIFQALYGLSVEETQNKAVMFTTFEKFL